MEQLREQLQVVDQGSLPPEESLAAALATVPLLMGADGVMVPFRPEGGQPKGKTAWHEVKVGGFARLGRLAPGRLGRCRLYQRRLVAIYGDNAALQRRLWLEAMRHRWSGSAMALEDCGGCLRSASQPMPQGSWTFTTSCNSCGRGSPLGWTDARAMRGGGSAGHGTACGMAIQTGFWLTWPTLWRSRGLPATARDTLRTVYVYLERHCDHINYAADKALGFPLGSGMAESACKWLIQQRFKGVGMRWSADGFNPLLHPRLVWVNGPFTALFEVQLQPSPNT